jgi:hypothetical protein
VSVHLRFVFAALALIILAIAAPLAVIGSDAYCRHSEVYWDAADCYKFSVKDEASDIVFIGDSSLQYGVRPNQLTAALGLSAYNLGLPGGTMVFLPYLLLDRYLAQNRRPRLIVLYLGPWSPVGIPKSDPAAADRLWVDAGRVALRHGGFDGIASVFGSDPRRLIQLPALFWQQGWAQFSRSGARWRQASGIMAAERGWMPFWEPGGLMTVGPIGWWGFSADALAPESASLQDDCVLQAKPVAPSGDEIRRFRERYERDGTRVLVYVAPIPACDPSHDAVVTAWRGIADNQPQLLPGHDFVDDGWRVHVTGAGATDATAQVADFLRSILSSRDGEPRPEIAGRPAAAGNGQPE